jgi:hypothetical protein
MLRTDTPEEQLVHYPHARARAQARARDGYRADPWPDRAAWTAKRHDVNGITVDNVRSSVSTCAAEYATPRQIQFAIMELDALWKATATDVRAANKAARAVFPLHGTRPRTEADFDAWHAAYDALTPEPQSLLHQARSLAEARRDIHRTAKALRRIHIDNTTRGSGELATADNCPTYMTILRRIGAAGDKAAADYIARIQSLPVDDEAWAKELAGREKKEAWFRDGPIVRHYSTDTADAR